MMRKGSGREGLEVSKITDQERGAGDSPSFGIDQVGFIELLCQSCNVYEPLVYSRCSN
jgi:hypothetical protein